MKNTTNERFKGSRSMTHKWKDMDFSQNGVEPTSTGYDIFTLSHIARQSVSLPAGFNVHSRLERMHIANRIQKIDNNHVDWATAEAMALVSLNMDGYNTRIVGEDSERGTFSQRHAVFKD